MLVDTHSHIEMSDFTSDLGEVVARAQGCSVGAIICVGLNLSDSARAVQLAQEYPCIYATVGVHPHDAQSIVAATYPQLEELAQSAKVVAYGEIGLDFFHDLSPRAVQRERFAEQLAIAARLGLPVVIHDRDAHAETLAIIRSSPHRRGGVFHCFSGDVAFARQCLDEGFYISITGVVTFPKAQELREVVEFVPLSRLLIETDCPFLTPRPHRGKRNEPAYVSLVAQALAEIKGITVAEVALTTTANAEKLFGISLREEGSQDG
ncbi:MAG: TatD family hydrolase [Deltaproteobacteria bacterium]|nr:TatD family hydrolase [Deltaproteobacteria bacterium]